MAVPRVQALAVCRNRDGQDRVFVYAEAAAELPGRHVPQEDAAVRARRHRPAVREGGRAKDGTGDPDLGVHASTAQSAEVVPFKSADLVVGGLGTLGVQVAQGVRGTALVNEEGRPLPSGW